MKLIAEALSPAAPAFAGPFPSLPPAWPLLDSVTQPGHQAEPREPVCGTLVQLFGGLGVPLPAASAIAPPPGHPTALPAAAFAPAPQAAVAPPPATGAAGPFPASWAPPHPVGVPAGPAALVPADRVTAPLGELMQSLGRGSTTGSMALAALRLPGGGSR